MRIGEALPNRLIPVVARYTLTHIVYILYRTCSIPGCIAVREAEISIPSEVDFTFAGSIVLVDPITPWNCATVNNTRSR
jgi:hypothetical protein